MGYYIWGIHDKTHEITGTHFDQNQDVDREPFKHWLRRQLSPDIEIRFEEGEIEGKRVVTLLIPAAKTVPTSFRQERYIRILHVKSAAPAAGRIPGTTPLPKRRRSRSPAASPVQQHA